MFYIITCSFPASPSATHDTVINAAWVWLQSSARYSFSTLPPCAPAGFPFRQSYTSGEDQLELLGCAIGQAEYTALRLTKPDARNNVVWTTDLIFDNPRDGGDPWIRVQLGRGPIDPGRPCDLTAQPQVPGLVAVLKNEGLIAVDEQSLPRLLVGSRQSASIKKKLRHQLGALAWLEDGAGTLPADVAVRLEWEACGVTRDFPWCDDTDVPVHAAAREVFWLTGQIRGRFPVDFELLQQLCPQADPGMPDANANYCFMNTPMAAKLRATRREQGMSQSALAHAVNVTNLVISRLETQRVSRAPVALIRQIEQALGLPADAILSLQKVREEPPAEVPAVREEPAPPREEPETARRNRFCRLCGAKLYEDSRFCSSCGAGVLP